MEIESKQQILEQRKEIEREIIDLLKETESYFTLDHVRDVIYHEKDNDDMMKVMAMFDRGGDASELSDILELVTDAWNYFPHKVLGGLSPAEKLLEHSLKSGQADNSKVKITVKPKYNLDKIKFSTDAPTFEKAVDLYECGKVTSFKEEQGIYSATVLGSEPYWVSTEAGRYDHGNCECYLGQNDTLCKHMVAVAIYAVMNGKKLSAEDKKIVSSPVCSGRLGELNEKQLLQAKETITSALKHIKSYNGPSKIWFAYQNSLDEGCNRLSAMVSELPVSEQTAKILIDLLLRLDKKLSMGGVDDSNGTVGGFIEEAVIMLKDYAKLDPACLKAFKKLRAQATCFGWEEPLVELTLKD